MFDAENEESALALFPHVIDGGDKITRPHISAAQTSRGGIDRRH